MAKKLKFKVGDEVIFLENNIRILEGTRATVVNVKNVLYPYAVQLENGATKLCFESELDFYESEEPFIPPANNQGVYSQ